MSKTLFTNVNILDSTGTQPFLGEVLIIDEHITDVRAGSGNLPREDVRVIDGRGQTLMSGLCDAHTHFTWNDGDLNGLETMHVEEHLLHTVQVRQNPQRRRRRYRPGPPTHEGAAPVVGPVAGSHT